MSLTRKQLKDLQLDENTIEEIIAAHVATIEGLRGERDAALAAAAQVEELTRERDELRAQVENLTASLEEQREAQTAFEEYLTQESEQRMREAKESALRAALEEEGCNRYAVELILRQIELDKAVLSGGSVVNAGDLIAPLKEKYAPFFARPTRIPTPAVEPPVSSEGALDIGDVSRMSVEEINRNWSAVRSALSKGAM